MQIEKPDGQTVQAFKKAIIRILADTPESSSWDESLLLMKAGEIVAKEAALRRSLAEKSYRLTDKLLNFPAAVLEAIFFRSTQKPELPSRVALAELRKAGVISSESISISEKHEDQALHYQLTEVMRSEIKRGHEIKDNWNRAMRDETLPPENPPKAERRLASLQNAVLKL